MKGKGFVGLFIIGMALIGALGSGHSSEELSPYKVTEFVVERAPQVQDSPAISGRWAVWRSGPGEGKRLSVRNLDSGETITVITGESLLTPVDVSGDVLVAAEYNPENRKGIFGYRLPGGERFTIAPLTGDAVFYRTSPRIDGETVVWAEGSAANRDIYGRNLRTGETFPIVQHPALQEDPAISGNYMVWRDARHAADTTSFLEADLYGYDLASRREFRITPRTGDVGPPAISGNRVVWRALREGASYVVVYSIPEGRELITIPISAPLSFSTSVDIDGDLVVWNAQGEYDGDIFGYDLKLGRQFIISRAIGNQMDPHISGRRVIWVDTRNSGVGKYEYDADIYGALLGEEPTPPPPYIGAPEAADARIEILWPHGGAPVTEADRANIGVWLFYPNTLKLTPCQWSPRVQLWRSLNNEPARLVALGRMVGDLNYSAGRAVPTWAFNDVSVYEARDPRSKLYFFITLGGTPSRSMIWAHGADPRTYFPLQDVPVGTSAVVGAVEAKIEIVWPHDAEGKPRLVAEAPLVNIRALLLRPGTLLSVPSDWTPRVRLLRALNNEVLVAVAEGKKRLIQAPGFTYPVWDFDDVDVSGARDPANKYYFTLEVEGVQAFPNIWAHGADARTYFPQKDTPASVCQ